MKQKRFGSWQICMAICVTTLCLAGLLSAQPQGQPQWKTYSYPADGFSISTPSLPKLDKQNVKTDAGTFELRAYLVEDGSSALYVGVCDYGQTGAGRDPDTVLQGAKNGAITNVQAHIVSEGKISLGVYPGLSFEAENTDFHLSARIFYLGTTLYQTLIARALSEPYANADVFLNSFQLLARTRP